MKRHTTVDLDPDLVEVAKRIGGRGIITTLCTKTLEEFADPGRNSPSLTPADIRRIAELRAACDLINAEQEAIRDCWEHFVKLRFGSAIATMGLGPWMMSRILPISFWWIYVRTGTAPIEREITERFATYHREQRMYFRAQRIFPSQLRKEMESELANADARYRQERAAWAATIGPVPEPHPGVPGIAEVSNGRS